MEWIKRNILFVTGSAVALVLMGLAGFYLVSGSKKNDAALEKLNAEYATLERLNNQTPHPGDETTDNIAAAKEQKKQVDAVISQATGLFRPIDSIPSGTNVSSAMFAGALRKTIDQLQSEATKRGVQVSSNFYFSFTGVRDRIMFDKAGLPLLAAQLGDVKIICDVLIDARVNALDSVRRERVSVHDLEAQLTTDYLMETSTTNEIGILTPYEVSFRCFSSELAGVLSGYASSPHGLIVRAMNVEPATMASAMNPGGFGNPDGFTPNLPGAVPEYSPDGYPPGYPPPTAYPPTGVQGAYPTMDPYGAGGNSLQGNRYANEDGYEGGLSGNRYLDGNRYGEGGAAGYQGNRYLAGNDPYGAANTYPPATPVYPTTSLPAYARARLPGAGRGGLPTMLDEKQIKVTMLVQVVNLIAKE